MSKSVVVASGYFSPLHYGHVSYLQKAKDNGSHLIVIVNNDRQTARKAESQPGIMGMPARDRVRLVRSLACVDAAIEAVDDDESVALTLRMLHPDFFANGGQSRANPKEAEVCRELGIQMIDGLGTELLLLKGFTQHYDWGKPKKKSAVALLSGDISPKAGEESPTGASTRQRDSRPFAELWMGDHPAGPSEVKTPGGAHSGCLISHLKRSPSVLGEKLAQEGTLPFLMKVLSIEKALSIQAHPDRELAARLHRERPDVYKDANHKPEIAIALTDFEALCGFRPVGELLGLVDAVSELAEVVGAEAVKALRDAAASESSGEEQAALKLAYSAMMRRREVVIERLLMSLVRRSERAQGEAVPENLAKIYKLVRRLHGQFGNDIGVFSVFFLNYVEMTVGDCLYMPQNTPHAYLSGDIVECMACSDNVVRGGLTPKYKDLEVLCEMLVYRGGLPPSIKPVECDEGALLYTHEELNEFQVTHIKLTKGKTRRFCFSGQGPSLGFAWKGDGVLKISDEKTKLSSGVVFLLAAGKDCDITCDEDLDLFVACCPPHYFQPPPRKPTGYS